MLLLFQPIAPLHLTQSLRHDIHIRADSDIQTEKSQPNFLPSCLRVQDQFSGYTNLIWNCSVCAVPGPPASLEFESPTEKSLILSWSPPAETNGILLGYIVQYQRGKV